MTALDDFRSAARSLARRPSHVVIAATTLALGIGITTAVFSVVDAMLLRHVAYRDASRVVNLGARDRGRPANAGYTLQGWQELRQRSDAFEDVAAYIMRNVVMTGGAEPVNVTLLQASPNAFRMLGVSPLMGRSLSDDDFTGASGPVVVLSHRLWREQLGGDPGVIGRRVNLDDVPHLVVGVMPAEFVFPRVSTRAWVPLPPPAPATAATRLHQLVARLRHGVSFEQASQIVAAMGPRLTDIRGIVAGRDPAIDRLANIATQDRQPLWIMFGAVMLVLAVACANVANLGLADGVRRRGELALCLALGAPKRRLVRQLLLENLMLAAAGGIGGAWLAYAAVAALAPLMPAGLAFFNANQIHVDGRVLAFALVMVAVTAVATGLLPAIRGSRAEGSEILKSRGRSVTASRTERRMLSGIGVAQCALAVLLLVTAGLLMRSFLRLQAVDPGFDPTHLAVLKFVAPPQRYTDAAAHRAFREGVTAALAGVPGVVGTAISGGMPPQGGGFFFDVTLETDRQSTPVAQGLYVAFTTVTPNYFDVLRIPLRAGRVFSEGDPAESVVIDEVFAARYWGTPAAAVGGRFRVDSDEPWHSIVGVVGDVKQLGLDDRYGPLEYYSPWPVSGRGASSTAIGIRTTGDPAPLIAALKDRIWSVDPKLAITQAEDIQASFAAAIERPRFFLTLMTVFALVAAAVAALGIYSLVSYSVSQRTHEIAIHLAVGAMPRQIAFMVVRQAVVLSTTGAAIGLLTSWGASRVLQGLLFHTAPTDPAALALGSLAVVTVAVIACYVPARRAQRVDPIVMLKVE